MINRHQRRQKQSADRYRYRNLPCSIAPNDQLWAISGEDTLGGAGILEWCYDEDDAKDLFQQMSRDVGRFRHLKYGPYKR